MRVSVDDRTALWRGNSVTVARCEYTVGSYRDGCAGCKRRQACIILLRPIVSNVFEKCSRSLPFDKLGERFPKNSFYRPKHW